MVKNDLLMNFTSGTLTFSLLSSPEFEPLIKCVTAFFHVLIVFAYYKLKNKNHGK